MSGGQADLALERVPELQRCLREAFGGRSVELTGQAQLKTSVHRLWLNIDGGERSVVVKRLDPVVARRGWLVARRWLPAVGLQELGPPLLTVAAEHSGEGTWHVYDDLPGRPLSAPEPVDSEIEAAIDAIARVHTSFAEHPLLHECRLWGGDRGSQFYSSNVRDAVNTLRLLDYDGRPRAIAARDALLERMNVLVNEEAERSQAFAAVRAPETLLHGDLWPTNAIVHRNGDHMSVRLVDWDEAAAGPNWFDVSTFLLRFESSYRPSIFDAYRSAVDRLAGWQVPDEGVLNPIFETAAYARLASLLVWSVSAAANGDSGWLIERLEGIGEWLDQVAPVLPAR
jgi:hypothetical protein